MTEHVHQTQLPFERPEYRDYEEGRLIATERDLTLFEDNLTTEFLPDPYNRKWQREPTSDLIKPRGFHGNMTEATVMLMRHPYEDLVAKFATMAVGQEEWYAAHTIGYRLLAPLHSTGRGIVMMADARVWIVQWRLQSAQSNNYGPYLRKIDNATGKVNQEKGRLLWEESKALGESALRHALQHPYRAGLARPR